MTYIDPVKASPKHYRTLLENEHVRVVEMTLRAGDRDNQHSHPDETVFFITGGKVRINVPDGEAMEADLPDGHVIYALFTAPARSYDEVAQTFGRMLRTLAVNDVAAHRVSGSGNPLR